VKKESFAIQNTSGQSVTCRIEVLASDTLIDAAALDDLDPKSNVWAVRPMHNPAPPPNQYELNTAEAHVLGGGSGVLNTAISLSPGAYDSFIYSCGPPLGTRPMAVDLSVAGVNLAAGAPADQRGWSGWHWYTGAPLRVASNSGPLSLRVTAAAPNGAAESWFDLAYVALQTQSPEARSAPRPEFWSTTVTIPAGVTQRWTPVMSAERKRIDVWVFEQAENGHAYRIFREWSAP
jgi:hypothetical protein